MLSQRNDHESPSPVQVRRVESFESLESRRQEWNEIVELSDEATIFQTFEWNETWWKTHPGQCRLLLLSAEIDSKLVGVAPLMIRPAWFLPGKRLRSVEAIGGRDSDYRDFILHPEWKPQALKAFWSWLEENEELWDSVLLASVPEDSQTGLWIPGALEASYKVDVTLRYEAPTRVLGVDPDADQAVVRKKSLRRHYNYFNRNGELQFLNLTESREIEPFLEAFFAQHIERWELTSTPSQFEEPRNRNFFTELVRVLSRRNWLLFSAVLFDGEPIAFHLGFQHKNRLIWYKPTYNLKHARHSPGEVLLKLLLEYALEGDFEEFDFTVGEEHYKYRFSNKVRTTYDIRVFRAVLPFCVYRLLKAGKRVVVKVPRLSKWAKGLQRRVRRLEASGSGQLRGLV